MSIYLRVKRAKATYFVSCEPTDTALSFKNKVVQMMGKPKDAAKDFRLQVAGKTPNTFSPLEDSSILEQVGLSDDGVVYLTYWISDSSPEGGSYEPVVIEEYEPLIAAEETEESGKGKAHA
ncbi:hypothetical protein HDU76_013984 [Blyttiomyces sp. JEL0837]|nr:hypothetical protein HDU76_013984 [Blyttiomyces sp. JEL0837]